MLLRLMRDRSVPKRILAVRLLMGTVLVCTVGCIALWVFFSMEFEAQYRARPLPPLYHNAQQISEQVTRKADGLPTRIITFLTSDEPRAVQEYYRSFMRRVGWSFGDFPFTNAPDTAYYQYWPDDGPVYKVLITANSLIPDQTRVKIEMNANGSEWDGEAPQ
jgi:hypothetical protein